MAQNIDWDKGVYSEPAGSEPDWDSGVYSEPPKPRTRGLFETANDTVIEFANAAAGGVSALANFAKPGNAVSSFIDENIIKAGEAKQSDVVRAEKQRLSQGLQNAQGIGDEVGAVGSYVLDNPLLAASQAVGSFALPGGAVKGAGMAAKALGSGVKGVETAGRVGGIAAGAAMAGGDAAGTAYDLSSQAGATEEQALAAGRQASVIPALVGGVTGAFGAERLLAGAKGFGGNALSRGLKSGLSEAGQEAVEEGVTQYEGQRAAMPYDPTIDPTKGVAGAAAMGGIMGFGPGAVLGAMGGGPELPSKQMGIDPSAGPLSRAAASAVDSAQPSQLGFSPLAGTPIIYPDGSVTLNGEQDFQKRTGVGQGMDLSKIAQPSQPLAAEKKVGQPVASEQKDAALKESAPVAPVSEAVPLEQRSLDELRQALRGAQDPGIRRSIAAEIRKRREAAPVQPSLIDQPGEKALEPQAPEAVQSQPQEAPPAALGKPLTETGAGMLGRGADPLQPIIQGQSDERRAADELRTSDVPSTGAGSDIAGAGVEPELGAVRGRGADAAVTEPAAKGDAGSGVGSAAGGADALRPKRWRTNAIQAGKVARSLGLDPKGKRLKEIVAEIDAVDAGSGVAANTEPQPNQEQPKREEKRSQTSKEERQKAIDAETMETRKPTQVAQPTPMKRVSFETLTLSGPKKVNAKLYELPGYDGPQLAVAEYKTSRGTGYKVYLPKSGAFITDSNGVSTLEDTLQLAVLRIKNARETISKRQPANVQNTPSSTAGTEAKAAPVEESTADRGDAAANGSVPAKGQDAGVRTDGVKRSMGRYGDAMTITQADAKVKELEKEARDLRKQAASAQTKFMENTARDGATRAATLARKLRDDIKDAVGAYPDARAEFEALKSGAGDVQADGVKPKAKGPATAQQAIDAFNADDSTSAMEVVARLKLDELQKVGEAIGFRPQINENAKRYRERLAEVAAKLTKTGREELRANRAVWDRMSLLASEWDRMERHTGAPEGSYDGKWMTHAELRPYLLAELAKLELSPFYEKNVEMVSKARPALFKAAQSQPKPEPSPEPSKDAGSVSQAGTVKESLTVEKQADDMTRAEMVQKGRYDFAAGVERQAGVKAAGYRFDAWLQGWNEAKDDAEAKAAGNVAVPSDFPLQEVSGSYSGISHSGSGRARSDRDAFVKRVQSLYDEAKELAKTEAQQTALDQAIKTYKDEYIAKTLSLARVRAGTYSAFVAGRAKINTRQADSRNSALDKAIDRFSAWDKEAAPKVKAAVLSARTADEVAAEQAEKDAAQAAKQEKRQKSDMDLMRKILAVKDRQTFELAGMVATKLSNDKDGYPLSLTIKAKDGSPLVNDKLNLATEVFGRRGVEGAKIGRQKIRDLVDAIKAEKPAEPVNPEPPKPAQPKEDKPAEDAQAPKNTAENPPSKTPTIDRSMAVMDAVRAGTGSLEDYKASFAALESSEEAVKAELNAKTKDELLKAGGPYFYMRFKNETKPEIIKTFYKDLLNEYALGKSYGSSGWVMSSGGFAAHEKRQHEALKALVEAQTEEDLKTFAAEVAARREEVKAKREAKKAAMENPQALEDFRAVMREHITDGKTRKEAFLMLTPEQRVKYDELEAETTKEAREARKRERKTEVRAADQSTGGQIIATKHTRSGYDLFVVQLSDRLSREDYNTVLASAKKLGGWYSSFRGNGAVPGFQFKEKPNAEAFLKLAGGDTTDAQAQAEQRRDAFEDDRSQTAVERLRTMADKLEELARDIEGADRKTNTARRAKFASRALAGAAEMKAKAKTMRNVAQSIEDGKAKFLDGIRTKTQVDMLTGIVGTAKYNELVAKYPTYAEQEKRKGEPPTAETADFAEFPAFTAYRSDLASLARQMLEVEGTKKLGQQLMKIADDVSDAYIEFAKQPGNLAQLSTFSLRRGDEVKTAIFPSKDLAERAIKRSGLIGKAIVLAEKRGVNRIIMSPSEAINAGIWTGDGDKRITLTADAGNTLVEAIGRRGNKRNGLAVPWQFQTAHDRLKALARMGIETPAEFRSALREFIGQKEQATSNNVRELELAMAGKKNDGLDFFPTPAEVADQMVEAADLTPEMDVLEPSGGMGHIADRIRDAGAEPDVVEIAEDRRELLTEKGYELVGRDFLDLSGKLYDRIVMNPPFSNRRDAEHVQHAYKLLKPGGRIVAIMGEGVFFGKDKKAQDFRDWLDSVGGTDEKLPAGSFMDPSLPVNTGVNARMVVIDKPANEEKQSPTDDEANMGSKSKPRTAATPVDRAVMSMAADGKSGNDILQFIANASRSPYRRQLAKKLLATGANPAVSLGGDMGGGAGFRFLAKYSRKDHEVTLSESAADRAEQIFLHETTHAATLLALDKGGLFATQMNRLYESAKKQGGADGQYGMKNVGEFVAEAFTNPTFQKALKGMKADTGSLWDRFVAMVRRVLGLPDRQQDMLSAALDLGAKVMRENMPLRAARSFRAEDGPAFAGVDQTETPEFKRWFGDSKVVDSAGRPLVVYHGTAADFDSFDNAKTGANDRGLWGRGHYFAANPESANSYAMRQGDEARVIPAYVSIKNPLILTTGADLVTRLPDGTNYKDLVGPNLDGQKIKDIALSGGHDGVVQFRPNGMIGDVVAYDANQIKSATGNRGTFDPNDPDIAHFGIADAVEQIKQFDVKTAPTNTWAHYRGMALQALGRRQLVDLYSEELPQLETYNDLVQQMDAEKNDTGAEADRVAQDWGSLKGGMDRKLAELMHDATLAKMDPDKPMPAGYFKRDYDALKARFDALSPEAKTLYRKARDMYLDHYKAVQQAIKDRVERSEMSEGQKRKMMADLDDKLFKELKGVYFPLARFGQYVIVVKDANGEVVNVTRAETVKEAEQARKELQKAFPAHMGNTVGKVLKQAEFNAGRDAVGKGFMADLMGALDEKGVDDELRDTVAQLYLSSLPDLSWAKHGIHRKGTPGFSQDARRAFAQNMFHGARYLAKLRHADRLQDLLIEMQDHIKAYEGVEEYDSVQAQQVVDEMVKRHEWLMNPKASPVSTALTSFGFLFHMGLSPASAMVNLTQTALVAFPQMGAKWGFTKSGAALTKAAEETVRAKNDLSKSLKGDELDAFNRAVKDGTIDVTMAHDLAGIAQGEDQGVMWKVRPVMRWASFMFHHAEKFNRQATFLAAYRLAKEANPAATQSQLYEMAKQATYDGHFDYSASNRARMMQGNWQRVIFLFKNYAQHMVYALARNAYQSVKALDPKERAQARKTLGGILAAHAAAAGVLGLPIVGPLMTVASWIGGDDDEPWDAEVAMQNAMAEMIGPKPAEVIARGFSRLTPFDLSGRVALNKLILPDVQEGLEGKEWAESAMAAALGPVAGIGVNIARGVQKMTDGDYVRGLEDMMPTAIRGPIRALRYADEGAVDKTGVTITEEVSLPGVLGQASGFAPSQVRRDTERRSAIYSYDRALLERRSVLMRMFAQAQMSGDLETAQEVRQDIQRFNEKNPTRRITPMNLAASIRNRRKRIEEAEQGVYLPSKRRDALEVVTF